MKEDWDEFNPVRDLSSLEELAAKLLGEVRPADARLVRRALRALGGVSDERAVYRVEARSDDPGWVISVPALVGLHSQADAFADVEPVARDAVALWLATTTGVEVEEDSFDLVVEEVSSE